ncbi:MAG: MlaD family protein [Nostocaceae cyanobacterium]|nr:MlaD family protein [Nostocaceae cyanobacterium]
MRNRTFREGSVGLLLLLGLTVLAGIILWLNRIRVGATSYKIIVEFDSVGGMQKGAVVRYRGVKVGNISAITPGANNIEVEIEIFQPDLIIPQNVLIEANQSGLISESVIDITPKAKIPTETLSIGIRPLDENCDRQQIIVCNNSRLEGQIGISTDELIRTTSRLATIYTDPTFYAKVNQALKNTSEATKQIAALSKELTKLTKSSQQQLGDFAGAAKSVSGAADGISQSTNKAVNQLSSATNEFATTARQINITVQQANQLLKSLDSLVNTNRDSLVAALNNITDTSKELKNTVRSLSPSISKLTEGEILQNLEILSANAAQASANLRDVSQAFSDSKNVVVLQQTLDSARVTFENTQKITSDLDDLTGDPKFRQNLRRLVNGLSSLVSSTQEIQQQVQVAATLDAVKTAAKSPNGVSSKTTVNLPQVILNPPDVAVKSASKQPQQLVSPFTSTSSQEKLLQQLRKYRNQKE